MRKLPFYVCTAVFAVGAMTSTAYGMAAGAYNVPGGKAVVIGGSNMEDLRNVLGQMQGSFGGSCSGNAFWVGGGFNGGSGSLGGNGCGGNWCFENNGCGDSGCTENGPYGNGACGNEWIWGNMGGCITGGGQQPDKPGDSGRPDVPDKPGDSGKPDVPDKPGDSGKPDIPDKDKPGQGTTQDAYAAQVVKLVNEERVKAGLPALTVHTGAESAAMVRAKEIERSFSHTRPDGSSFYTALQSAGIRYQSAGENIAYGQTSPGQVMDSWMNSSGHRANILSANYDSIAVAHYRNGAGVDYWVQLFVK